MRSARAPTSTWLVSMRSTTSSRLLRWPAWAASAGYGTWKYSRLSRRLTDAKVRRRLGRLDVDAVVGVADIETIADVPTFLFQDANFSVVQAHHDLLAEHAPALVSFPAGRLDELVAEQRAAYASAAGVLSFSQWFADWLVEHDGVPRERVHVVGGGLHDLPAKRTCRPAARAEPRCCSSAASSSARVASSWCPRSSSCAPADRATSP